MSNKQQFEREFEEFLNEENSALAALYRKLPRPEPDAKVDAAIAALARRAVASSAPARTRAPRWIPVLSAAAVVALAAGIAFRIGPTVWQQRNEQALPQSQNAMSAGTVVKEQDTDALKDKAAPKPTPMPAEPAMRSMSVPAPAPASAPAAPPAVAKAVAPAPHKTESAAERLDAPAPQAFPLQAEQEKKRTQPGAAYMPAQGGTTAQSLERQRDERAQTTAAPMAAPVREEAAPPPPPAAAPAPAAETPAMSGAAADSMLAAPPAKAARMAPPRSKDPNARLYPEHWLQNIRTMLREDKRDEALRSLAEFRKMYPDYHLPDDLRDLK